MLFVCDSPHKYIHYVFIEISRILPCIVLLALPVVARLVEFQIIVLSTLSQPICATFHFVVTVTKFLAPTVACLQAPRLKIDVSGNLFRICLTFFWFFGSRHGRCTYKQSLWKRIPMTTPGRQSLHSRPTTKDLRNCRPPAFQSSAEFSFVKVRLTKLLVTASVNDTGWRWSHCCVFVCWHSRSIGTS